ncbi:hypothetical protein HYPSUDRAFT_585106 [Hypholoma sublateritium FD-334 SS-4]|uniref:Uncharacterized protein n=1 Tax=Hypholoma sublateritium (strain FD-334 SS-4) TaxID=945553 RepID=A0A0D2N982_HYPSF|nr:hypothetical protein HYPSUDRAFT_585106 [Hypholoma sublateritium FD-334 SS-4]
MLTLDKFASTPMDARHKCNEGRAPRNRLEAHERHTLSRAARCADRLDAAADCAAHMTVSTSPCSRSDGRAPSTTPDGSAGTTDDQHSTPTTQGGSLTLGVWLPFGDVLHERALHRTMAERRNARRSRHRRPVRRAGRETMRRGGEESRRGEEEGMSVSSPEHHAFIHISLDLVRT